MEKNKNIAWFVNNSEFNHREMGLRHHIKDGWFWMEPNQASIIGWCFVQSTHVVLKASGPFVCSACLVVKCVEPALSNFLPSLETNQMNKWVIHKFESKLGN